MDIINLVASELKLKKEQVEKTVELLDEGATIPFIARYRKEKTGSLDETKIRDISERVTYLRALVARKEEVLRLIGDKLTPEIETNIAEATILQAVEDIYLPFRPKRRTRATIAREKGLEPLSEIILAQKEDPLSKAEQFITEEVPTLEEALAGARDIVAEVISEDFKTREWMRRITRRVANVEVQVVPDKQELAEAKTYQNYFEFKSLLKNVAPHQVLAINRAEKEGFVTVKVCADSASLIQSLKALWLKNEAKFTGQLELALVDSYLRLLAPSIERDLRREMTEAGDRQAISVFQENLRHLLLLAPVRGKVVLGLDPGYRTGTKVAVVNDLGDLLATDTIYPHEPQKRYQEAKERLIELIKKYKVDLITIGNGTASRETEALVSDIAEVTKVNYAIVSEAGASVYSASPLAKEEFPQLDVSLRGAVSIARRIQDPLAELVKIDPKSIGVGQYQHDVNQKELAKTLDYVVMSAVNHVGVELNTASWALLQYVSGINKTLAQRIISYRQEKGSFSSRQELLEIKGIGAKTFEQAAGFLRIASGENVLDNTAVHPESYQLTEKIVTHLGYDLQQIEKPEFRKALSEADTNTIAVNFSAGVPTVVDILDSLQKPGRDPREDMPGPVFRSDILTFEDLQVGQILKGTVRNVVDFGAFVDIGVKRDGLIHSSKLPQGNRIHPTKQISVGEIVEVEVTEVDKQRQRISLKLVAKI